MMQARVVLATGGTGGHLFPAEALAAELSGQGHAVTIIMDRRVDGFKGLNDSVDIRFVRSGYFKPGIVKKLQALVNLGLGFFQAGYLLWKIKPSVVVGFGGYSALPTVLAAQIMGIPTMLHEQNAALGKANALLARCCKAIALSQPNTRGINITEQSKTVLTGNPVRSGIIAIAHATYITPDAGGDIRLLITGGSQAATVFSDVVPKALARLPESLRARLSVVHQCRSVDIDATAAAYQMDGIRAETAVFFADMPDRLRDCHLFIGRSGASTVAEIAAAGRPAIFVPYPGHADMQQKYNAEHMVASGGAKMFMQPDFTPEALSSYLESLLGQPDALGLMAVAARACGKPDATKNLAEVVVNLLGK